MTEERSPLRILLFCNRPSLSQDASTIADHIDAFPEFSKHDVDVWSSLEGLPDQIVLNQYDCLIIHYSISFLSERYVSKATLEKLRLFQGLKIVFIQDEYRRVNFICLNLKYVGVHMLYSCAPIDVARKMYASLGSGVLIRTTLTGYVPARLEKVRVRNYAERQIDIGYRARKVPFSLGAKGQDKFIIGHEMASRTVGSNLRVDISSREGDRLYGKSWIEFLENCKTTLGTDSGASIIDFDGEIEYKLARYQALHPFAKFSEVPDQMLKSDGELEIQVISPRCFEAAALGTALILFPGNYSGILRPNDHYLCLEKDFSNIAEILEKLRDLSFMQGMIAQARDELILSSDYSYRKFIEGFEQDLEDLILSTKNFRKTDGSRARPKLPKQSTARAEHSSGSRTILSSVHKLLPDWLKFILMVTILKRKFFRHLYAEAWSHLKG